MSEPILSVGNAGKVPGFIITIFNDMHDLPEFEAQFQKMLVPPFDPEEEAKAKAENRAPVRPGYSWGVVVIDAGATDGSKEYMMERGYPVIGPAKGLCEALNTGINYFLGDFVEADGDCWFQDARWHSIIWVHPDMRFESQPDWWLRLMTFLDDHPDVWKVGPNSYNLEGEPDDRPGNTCPWAMPVEAFKALAKDANRSYPGDPTYRMRGQFFDENYQRCHNYDDWDLNRRIVDLGKKVWITKQSKVWHKGMGSRGTYQDTGGWGQQNAGLYVKKWATNKSPV